MEKLTPAADARLRAALFTLVGAQVKAIEPVRAVAPAGAPKPASGGRGQAAQATAGRCDPAGLPKAAGEVAHRGLVWKLDYGSFSARVEHRLDVLCRNPRDHA